MECMPRAVDPEERHISVRRAVVRLAISEGFGAVTVRAIAAQLNASTTAVTHYFPTRDAMIAETLRHELGSFSREVDSMLTGLRGADAIRTFVFYVVFDAPQDLRRFWMRAVIDAPRETMIRSELQRFDQEWDARLGDLVDQLDTEKGATQATRADQVDLVISGAIMLNAEGVDETILRRTTQSLLDLILAP